MKQSTNKKQQFLHKNFVNVVNGNTDGYKNYNFAEDDSDSNIYLFAKDVPSE